MNAPISTRRAGAATLVAVGALLLGGCATTSGATGAGPRAPDPRDPFEPFNRGVTRFNDGIDDAVLKPVATAYRRVVPPLVRTGVGNFFRNLTEPWSFVNNALQLKPREAGETAIRFAMNTVFGLGGVLDIAGEADIDQHKQDFGQTLAYYGVPTGPYLVLPLLGPSTVRDTAALPADWRGNLLSGVSDVPVRNSLYALRVVDVRANLLRASSVLESAALDKYTFTRDAYLQLRYNATRRGGEIPEEEVLGTDSPEAAAAGASSSSAAAAVGAAGRAAAAGVAPGTPAAAPAAPASAGADSEGYEPDLSK